MTRSAPAGWTASLARQRERLDVGSTSERVAGLLRTQVLDGTLRPGVQLTEEQLVEALGVSRNTIREALQRLSAQRLVEHQRHRGVFVRHLGRDDLADLCGLRRALECGALREAAARGPVGPDATAAVVHAAREGERAAAAGDWDAAGTANASVHLALAALAGNARIDEEMRAVVAELRLAFVVLPDARAMHEPYVARNVGLADLVAAGDLLAAADALDTYLRDAEAHLLEVYGETLDA
jgi:DNA-binding GntR family transcriptional regulator